MLSCGTQENSGTCGTVHAFQEVWQPPRPPRTSTAICTINTPIHFRLYCDISMRAPEEQKTTRLCINVLSKFLELLPKPCGGPGVQCRQLPCHLPLPCRGVAGAGPPSTPRDSNCGSWRLVAHSPACPGQAWEHRLSEHLSVQITRLAPRLGTNSKYNYSEIATDSEMATAEQEPSPGPFYACWSHTHDSGPATNQSKQQS